MAFEVIIFDFDGVIVESVGIKDQAFAMLFQDHPQHLEEIITYHLSHNATIRFEKFRYITENILQQKYTEARAQELQKKYSQFVLTRIIQCPLVKGAEDFLTHFSQVMPLFLASVNPAQEIEEILNKRNLKKFFKKIYAHPWLKKDAILEILRDEDKSQNEAVFIGDSLEDYHAAREAGVFFIGRDSGKSFIELPSSKQKEKLNNGAKILIYPDLKQIKQYLCQSQGS